MQSRSEALRQLADIKQLDLVVIGGGATGLGIAVDAASRGYRTALIERSDFAAGTSSRSTKLVHGGVRYLRQGNISLVREALHERGRLAANAPHLVHARDFIIPTYSRREKIFYGVGLKLYDLLAGELGFAPSRRLSRAETLRALPTIARTGLTGGVLYSDGQFDDARLALTLAQTAADYGAVLANHCACTGLLKHAGRVSGIKARDLETGDDFKIRARAVVNATGVFVDEVRALDEANSAPLLAVSQGIHLVLPRRFLPGHAALMVPKTADGRVLFAVPWHDRVVVGTTDSPVSGPSTEPRALAAEREFIMTHAQRYLALPPRPEDVLSVFAGLRPLVKAGAAKRTASLSRDHTIVTSASGLVTVTGGKWTTYRRMAEDVVDQLVKGHGFAAKPCRTADLPLHGCPGDRITPPHLAVYGQDATAILRLIATEPGLARRLHTRLPYQQAEVVWHARQEMARTVEDVLARRTRALLLNAAAASEAAPVVADLLARELGHSAAWARQQTQDFQKLARGYTYLDPASCGDVP